MMEEMLATLVEKFLFKYKSLPFVFFLFALFCVPFIPTNEDESPIKIQLIGVICISVFTIYAVLCFTNNSLPRAKRGTCAVLFVVDAETTSLYNDVKNKLIRTFDEYINYHSILPFRAVCIMKSLVPNYNLDDSDSVLRLLSKTRTIFLVDIKYLVDDVSHAENYEIGINFGIIHPTFDNKTAAVLRNDMRFVQKPIRKNRFTKSHLLEQFDVTAQQLSTICKYIVGLVLLLSHQPEVAYNLLLESMEMARSVRSSVDDPILRLVENRVVSSCLILSDYYIELFGKNKNMEYLDKMNQVIEKANEIRPRLPLYFTRKAYYAIAKDRDAQAASEYVSQAKCVDSDKAWRYSEAFIAAFTGKSPLTIYRKYESAFKVEYNLVQIVDFIEYILNDEPERTGLILAAGLVYDEMGDKKLAFDYYRKYLKINTNETIHSILEGRMS